MIICARFWRNSKGQGERKTMDLGMCMVSQEAGILQRGIFLNTQTLSQLGGFTYLAGGGSHLGNVCAFMQRKKCYLSASQFFYKHKQFPATMLGISVLPAHEGGLRT